MTPAKHNRRAQAVRAARGSRAGIASRSPSEVARMQRHGPAGRCLVLAVLTVSPHVVAAQRPPLPAARVQLRHDLSRLRTWLDAAERHLPGQDDAPAVLVGSWTIPQLETVFVDFTTLTQIIARPNEKPKRPAMARALTHAEFTELRELAAQEAPTNGLDANDPRSAEAARRTMTPAPRKPTTRRNRNFPSATPSPRKRMAAPREPKAAIRLPPTPPTGPSASRAPSPPGGASGDDWH